MIDTRPKPIWTGPYFLLVLFTLASFFFQKLNAQTTEIRATDGTWTADIRTDSIQFFFHKKGYTGEGTFGSIFPLKELGSLPQNNEGKFLLKREAGTIEFMGGFTGIHGKGTYRFIPDANYKTEMETLNIPLNNVLDQMTFCLVNVTVSSTKMLNASGFKYVTKDDLESAVATGVDEAYIRSIRNAGFPNIKLSELIGFKSLGIDASFIDKLRKKGNTTTDAGTIMAIKANGILQMN